MLSLRKATYQQQNGLFLDEPFSTARGLPSMQFFSPQGVTSSIGSGSDDLPLHTYPES